MSALFDADYWISGHLELAGVPQLHTKGPILWRPIASSCAGFQRWERASLETRRSLDAE